MTCNGWIQIFVFCGIVVLLVKPLGGYMTRVFNGERTLLSIQFSARRARLLYRQTGTDDREEQHWIDLCRRDARCSTLLGFLVLYAAAARPGIAAIQSGRAWPRCRRTSPSTRRRQLRDQHQLAELRRRKHHVLSRRRWSA